MFLDASIIVAILGEEDDFREQKARVAAAGGPYYVSSIVRYEATVALARIRRSTSRTRIDAGDVEAAAAVFDYFVETVQATEIAISPEIGRAALAAAGICGKIAGHKAALNFGDCFSYAAAKALKVRLLYKGDDFAHTDLA